VRDPAPYTRHSLDVLGLLAELVDKSLVKYIEEQGRARYRLLETTREYAYEKLREHGEELEAQDRHDAFFMPRAREEHGRLHD